MRKYNKICVCEHVTPHASVIIKPPKAVFWKILSTKPFKVTDPSDLAIQFPDFPITIVFNASREIKRPCKLNHSKYDANETRVNTGI